MAKEPVGGTGGPVQAVVFDYFGTLTVSTPAEVRRRGASRVAEALGVDPEAYVEVLTATFAERCTGRYGDLMSTLARLARACGGAPTERQLAEACERRRAIERSYAAMVRPEAPPTLAGLRARGLRIGVLSDCTHELPEHWDQLPLAPLVDQVTFSVVAGRKKPDPSLYCELCEALGTEPTSVAYVGDGGSNELSGARSVGMAAVQLVAEDAPAALVYDREEGWSGPVISSLSALLDGPRSVVSGPA